MRWAFKIDIQQYIHADSVPSQGLPDSDLLPKEVRDGVVAELKKLPATLRSRRGSSGETIDDVIGYLENDKDIVTVADFDVQLENIFDWADENRVWTGFPKMV